MNSFFVFILSLLLCISCNGHGVNPLATISMESATYAPSSSCEINVTSPHAVLNNDGDWVVVSYSCAAPDVDDHIGVYSPCSTAYDPSHFSFIKFKSLRYDTEYQQTGTASTSFQLVNMRSDYCFSFLRKGFSKTVAISSPVTFENLYYPNHLRISLTSDSSTYRVSWTSKKYVTLPQIVYGTSPEHLSLTIAATSTEYNAADMCAYPATSFGYRDPGVFYHTLLPSLTPSTTYYYKVGSPSHGWSSVTSFKTLPKVHSTSSLNLYAFGDMGKGNADQSEEHWDREQTSLQTTFNMIKDLHEYDMILHIGDIAYAVGYSSQWDEFMSQIQPLSSQRVYQTAIGNHEYDYPVPESLYQDTDSLGECGVPYAYRFPLPSGESNPQLQWYSFNAGPAHIVVMSTEHNFSRSSPQYEFLFKDLSSVDRSVTPWLIVTGHRPMYVDSTYDAPSTGDTTVSQALQDELSDLFLEYQVDLALWGHHHSYQRTHPVHKGQVVTQATSSNGYIAPVHCVIGMAGMNLSQNLRSTTPAWIAYSDVQEYGHTRLRITPTELEMKFVSNFYSKVRDSFVLKLPVGRSQVQESLQ